MKIILTESQLKLIKEAEFHFDKERIPQIIKEIQPIIAEGKKAITFAFNRLKEISVVDILENPLSIKKQVESLSLLQKNYEQKYNKYYNIYDAINKAYYNIDEDNDDIWELDKEVTKLDEIQTDLYDIHSMMDDIYEVFMEGNGLKQKIHYFQQEYPMQTIDVTHRI
jgi:hypothetical protein